MISRLARMVRFRKSEDGAAAVEFALVSPILIAMIGAIFEGGMVMHSWGSMEYYGRQAARAVSIGASSHADAINFVKDAMATEIGNPEVEVTITEQTGATALDNRIVVVVTMPTSEISAITPFSIFDGLTVTRQIEMYKES